MLDTLAVMDQKDICALIVNLGSGMCRLAFTGYDASCVMSLLTSPGPSCSTPWPVWTRRTVAVTVAGWYFIVSIHLARFSLPWFAGP